jgi:preprotein translocase subunit SecG
MLLLAVEWYHYILATLFATICIRMILVILLQRGRGSGLAGAFGGAGGSSHLGAKTGDVLTLVTLGLAVVYVGLAISMNWWFVEVIPTAAPGGGTGGAPASGGPPVTPFIDESSEAAIDVNFIGAGATAERLLFGDPQLWPQPGRSAC